MAREADDPGTVDPQDRAIEEEEVPDEQRPGPVEPAQTPDVLLDVPTLHVDEVQLEVENLRARVSLQAEVLDLLKLNVGADVALGRVQLDITGVDAQAVLKVRLDNVVAVIGRVLNSIDRNPQILEHVTAAAGEALREVGRGGGRAVGELGSGAGHAVRDVGQGAGRAVDDVGAGAGRAVQDVGGAAGRAVEDVGEGAGRTVGDVGRQTGRAVRDVGEGAGRGVEQVVGDTAVDAVEEANEAVPSIEGSAGRVAQEQEHKQDMEPPMPPRRRRSGERSPSSGGPKSDRPKRAKSRTTRRDAPTPPGT